MEVSELHQKDKELIEKLEKEYEQKLKMEARLKEQGKLTANEPIEKNPTDSTLQFQKSYTNETVKTNIQTPGVKKFVPKKQQVLLLSLKFLFCLNLSILTIKLKNSLKVYFALIACIFT